MMNGMEAPKKRKPVEGAVDPILGEVGQHQDGEKLGRQRQRSEQGEVARGEQRVSKHPRGKQRRPAEGLYDQMAQQEMDFVSTVSSAVGAAADERMHPTVVEPAASERN